MIAFLCFTALSILLFAGFAWANARHDIRRQGTPPASQATLFVRHFGQLFRQWAPLCAALGVILFGLNFAAAHFGGLCTVALLLALFNLPSLFFSQKLGIAATAPRLGTDERLDQKVYLPLAAAAKIYQGTLVARDANGRAVRASDTAGLRVVGRAMETVDNTAGAAGDLYINIELGCFFFDNSAAHALAAADIGKICVVEDDQTVAKDSTVNLVSAGRVVEVSATGVWVDTRYAFFGARAMPALTSTDGTAGAAADLAALKAEAEKIGDDLRALYSSIFG